MTEAEDVGAVPALIALRNGARRDFHAPLQI